MRLGLSISRWSNLLYTRYPSKIWIHLTPSTRNSSLLKLSWNTMHLPTKVLLFGLIGDLFPLSPLPVPRNQLKHLLDPLPPVRHSDSLLVLKHLITLVQTPGFKVFPPISLRPHDISTHCPLHNRLLTRFHPSSPSPRPELPPDFIWSPCNLLLYSTWCPLTPFSGTSNLPQRFYHCFRVLHSSKFSTHDGSSEPLLIRGKLCSIQSTLKLPTSTRLSLCLPSRTWPSPTLKEATESIHPLDST